MHTDKTKTHGIKYNRTYTLHHTERGDITNVKTDRFYLYAPWSINHPSTSPALDDDRRISAHSEKIGTWCTANASFIMVLAPPYPFGVDKVLKAEADGKCTNGSKEH
jgi:hypothetical protein